MSRVIRGRWWKRILCVVGVHWHGIKGLGMYGDAARCHICGADAYGLVVVHDDPQHPGV